MSRVTYITPGGRRFRIAVYAVGCHFGHAADVYDARGRKRLASTDVVPYGMAHVARQRAEALADRVASVDHPRR